jgi:hypothetical protein
MTAKHLIAGMMRRWHKLGLEIRSGNSIHVLERFAVDHNVRLSHDIVQYFVKCDGMNMGITDDYLIRFWSLEEVSQHAGEDWSGGRPESFHAFVFADYSIGAHAYAWNLSSQENTDATYLVGGDVPILIASSFRGFLNKYLHETSALFPRKLGE